MNEDASRLLTEKFLWQAAVQLPLLLLAVSCHEASHGLAAWWQGDPTAKERGRVTLDPLKHLDLLGSVILPLFLLFSGLPVLGYAKPTPVDVGRLRNPKRGFSLVALAGPASNLVLAVLFSLLGLVLVGILALPWPVLPVFFREGIQLNLLLGLFNLIPLPTLDGLKALYVLLPDSWCWALNRLEPWGFVVIYGALYFGLFEVVFLPLRFCEEALFSLAHL
jgi:Zn-dependent protease